jgi:glycosyltransferase involved in cell wall biosynthesis
MNNILVSVLLSYYKGEEYLEGYLKNVCEQSFANYLELVFVGCLLSDKEKNIIASYEDKIKIKKIFLDELKPQSDCWNIGIKNSSADYCCIWNIDDVRTTYSVENQYNKINSDNDIGATYGMFIISRKFSNMAGQLIDHHQYPQKEYTRSFLLGPFFMFRKSLCEKIGYFDEQLRSGADFDFAIRLAANSRVDMIQSIDGYFLDVQKGLSTRGDNRQPIERTVVELRYGIMDKVDSRFIPATTEYNIYEIKQFGNMVPVSNFVPNYKKFLNENGKS